MQSPPPPVDVPKNEILFIKTWAYDLKRGSYYSNSLITEISIELLPKGITVLSKYTYPSSWSSSFEGPRLIPFWSYLVSIF